LSDLAARAFVVGNDVKLPKFPTPESAKIGARNSLLRRYIGGGKGPLPEEVSGIVVDVLYRLRLVSELATVLADWRRVDPKSEALHAKLAEFRTKPALAGLISNEKLAAMRLLFGERPLMNIEGPRSLARAKRLSNSYLNHYHHAVPFDRDVLRAAWKSCSVRACGKARDQIEKKLGKIDAPRRGNVRRKRPGAGSPVPDEETETTDLVDSPASS
jgi:hypothetical protein